MLYFFNLDFLHQCNISPTKKKYDYQYSPYQVACLFRSNLHSWGLKINVYLNSIVLYIGFALMHVLPALLRHQKKIYLSGICLGFWSKLQVVFVISPWYLVIGSLSGSRKATTLASGVSYKSYPQYIMGLDTQLAAFYPRCSIAHASRWVSTGSQAYVKPKYSFCGLQQFVPTVIQISMSGRPLFTHDPLQHVGHHG